MSVTVNQEMTVRGVLEQLLRNQGRHNRNDMVAPAAILWTDKAKAWAPVIATLRTSLPILTLGDYQPDALTGPAIWLRCVVDGTLPEVVLPEGIPILYLPDVSQNDLRAVESCPKHLRPLAELQYRGAFFIRSTNRDWTPAAFLSQSKIKVAEDGATKAALQRALARLLIEPVSALQPLSPLSADTLNTLLTPDLTQCSSSWCG